MPNHRERCASSVDLTCALLFSLPLLSALVLLFFFYLCCVRSRGFFSLRTPRPPPLQLLDPLDPNSILVPTAELGLKKELREMLPVLIYKESFSVNDSQCSVCLGEYDAEDRLQQIPACGHAFHMECIDIWLCTHTTCPLCRASPLDIHNYEAASTDGSTESVDRSPDVTGSICRLVEKPVLINFACPSLEMPL